MDKRKVVKKRVSIHESAIKPIKPKKHDTYTLNLMTKEHDHNVEFINPKTKKVDFSKLKYDLDDLFNNTPVFNYPWMSYAQKQGFDWSSMSSKILSPFKNIK